ncbi:endolytic transglycosylase MltG [Candidatus Saccharibacteria bacterium]|nr:endolytic transglycosylase MltG [Candidatus Saccharibacteria bacterium]
MKLIGLDVGTKRIGVAIADSSIRIAVPTTTINAKNGAEFAEIARIAQQNNTKWFVLGLPRNNSGTETAQSAYVREFAKNLASAIPGAKIRFQDESLTSVEAENRLKSRKKAYAKEEIDAEAAAIILQDCIEHLSVVSKGGTSKESNFVDARELGTPVNEKKEGNSMLKKFVVVLLVILLAGGLGAGIAFAWYNSSLGPVYQVADCSQLEGDSRCDFIEFSVLDGETMPIISDNLAAAGIIKNSLAFQIYMRAHNMADRIKTGEYRFQRTMDVEQIGKQLVEGVKDSNVFSFTILPGSTIKDIKADLLQKGYSSAEIEAAFAKRYDSPVLQGLPESTTEGAEYLEGFLFGDTYEFYKSDSVEKIIQTALAAMWEVVNSNNLVSRYSERGLTLYQGITLASIIQKEANSYESQRTVAQVFYSRMNQNIALGSDVTAKYAADLLDPTRKIYTDNSLVIEIDSPYNTRKHLGLTPGPICNPGISALLAVAEPTDTSYLYFLTGDDGVMYYSYTEAEHNQNIIDHCQNLCNVQL